MMPHLNTVQSGLALGSMGGGAVFLVIAAAFTARRRPHPAADAPPADEPKVVWLACHNIACAAHMTTRHASHDDGTATCQACGTERDQT